LGTSFNKKQKKDIKITVSNNKIPKRVTRLKRAIWPIKGESYVQMIIKFERKYLEVPIHTYSSENKEKN